MPTLPPVLRNRDFDLYWSGVVLSQIGTRGAVAANLYQVYALTGSVAYTGMVGGAQAVALLVLSPLGGVYADRLDRKRLLQVAQAVSLVVALVLCVLTFTGHVQAWHVIVSALLATAAATFDQPARQALIPALVPRQQLPQAIALLNPSREVAILVGPALAGLLIAWAGPGLVYLLDAATYAALVGVLVVIRVRGFPEGGGSQRSVLASIAEGAGYVAKRPLIWKLMTLDVVATVCGAYRVVLPALAVDVLAVGASGYGLLSSAPSAGALLATYSVFRVVDRSRRQGKVLLLSTVLYGVGALAFAQSPWFWLTVVLGLLLGAFDAMATTIRHAAVQIETPDYILGRVQAFYQMSSRGGPAIGDLVIGAFAGVVGPVMALTVGGLGPILAAGALLYRPNVVREYVGAVDAPEEPEPPPDARPTTTPTTQRRSGG